MKHECQFHQPSSQGNTECVIYYGAYCANSWLAYQRKDKNEIVPGKNITGVMSMTGKRGNASIALTFSEGAILQIAKNMLPGGEITTIDGMVIDLVGELANMVLGGAKSDLENQGYFFQLSLPTIILGCDYLVAHKTNAPIIILAIYYPRRRVFC